MSEEIRPDLPWLALLPAADADEIRAELADAVRDGAEPSEVAALIAEWQHAAELYDDPDLAAVLRPDRPPAGLGPGA